MNLLQLTHLPAVTLRKKYSQYITKYSCLFCLYTGFLALNYFNAARLGTHSETGSYENLHSSVENTPKLAAPQKLSEPKNMSATVIDFRSGAKAQNATFRSASN
ncbi:MAG: hypothetical protein AAFX54_17745 [Pseudomonadota bacterium]